LIYNIIFTKASKTMNQSREPLLLIHELI